VLRLHLLLTQPASQRKFRPAQPTHDYTIEKVRNLTDYIVIGQINYETELVY